jgi:hypothetical protein
LQTLLSASAQHSAAFNSNEAKMIGESYNERFCQILDSYIRKMHDEQENMSAAIRVAAEYCGLPPATTDGDGL